MTDKTICNKSRQWRQLALAVIMSGTVLVLCLVKTSVSLAQGNNKDEIKTILSLEADGEYGEYLAGECLTCHQVSGATTGVPQVAGLPAEYIVIALLAYKNGVRENQVMQSVAVNMGNDEIAALARYLSALGSE